MNLSLAVMRCKGALSAQWIASSSSHPISYCSGSWLGRGCKLARTVPSSLISSNV